jgi:hypothetical protein
VARGSSDSRPTRSKKFFHGKLVYQILQLMSDETCVQRGGGGEREREREREKFIDNQWDKGSRCYRALPAASSMSNRAL